MQLSRTDVVAAALDILDEYGLADLTMRRLANALGVAPGALYWHFPNKQTLLGAVADEILAPVQSLATSGDWQAQVAQVAHEFRNALLSRRDGAELVSSTYASRLTTANTRDRFIDAAEQVGMTRTDAELTAHAIIYFVLGHTVDEQSRLQMDSVGALTSDASPIFESPTATDRFNFGLNLLLAGIRSISLEPQIR